jgi:hypothetical protein
MLNDDETMCVVERPQKLCILSVVCQNRPCLPTLRVSKSRSIRPRPLRTGKSSPQTSCLSPYSRRCSLVVSVEWRIT